MQFPNASLGIKKIFIANIFGVVFAFLTIPIIIAAVAFNAAADEGALLNINDTAITGTAIVFFVCGFIITVLAVVSCILNLVGAAKAAKDEPSFRSALVAVVIALVAILVSSIFSLPAISNQFISTIATSVSDIANLCFTLYIIQGICNLAKQLSNDVMARRGITIFKIILASVLLKMLTQMAAVFFVDNTTAALIFVCLRVVANLLDMVQFIMFIVYLGKAKKMLHT